MRVLCTFLFFLLMCREAMAQTITEQVDKKPIGVVLNNWAESYKLKFAFDSYELSNYSFTGAFETMPIDEALNRLLANTPYSYRVLNDTYVIYPSPSSTLEESDEKPQENLLTGFVVDRLTGESLPFAAVASLVSAKSTTTDENGVFTLFYNGPVILDTLVVVYLGYVTYRIPFSWSASSKNVKIQLVAAHALLPDVEIQATSIKPLLVESQASTVTVNPYLSGLRYGVGESDIFRPAQFASGISAAQENSNGLFIRGSSSDQSQLLFDGFTIYHQDHFFGMFSAVNALSVKSMRIHKAPTDAVLGGRAAGYVEVVGKEGDLRKPSATVELGTMSFSGAFETPLDTTGKASLYLSGRRSITEWLKGPAYTELFRTLYSASVVSANEDVDDENSFDPQLIFQDINTKFTFKPSYKNHITASFYASRDEMSFMYADTTETELVNVSDIRYSDEATKSNRGASVRWTHRFSPRLQALTSIGFSAFQGVYFSTDSIRNNLFATDSARFSYRDVLLRDWTVLHNWQFKSSNHTTKAGVALNAIETNEKARSSYSSIQELSEVGYVLTAFAGDEWVLTNWIVQPGVRLNLYRSDSSFLRFEPKVSARYLINGKDFYLKAAAVRAVQFVQRITNQSLYQNVPDQWQLASTSFPVLQADQVMMGANYTRGKWNMDLEAYLKYSRGQVLNAAAGHYTNTGFEGFYSGQSEIAGVDATAQWERPPHRAAVAYTYLYARSNYEGFDQRNVRESHIRSMEGKANYEFKKGRWNASVVFILAQGSPFTALVGTYDFMLPDGNSTVLPLFGGYNRASANPYFRTDLACGYQFQWGTLRMRAEISIYNLLDSQNYRAMQYSVERGSDNQLRVNERPIQMLGRIPSITLTGQF